MYNSQHSNASNVAHNWANQLPTKYKKDTIAGSLYFEGKTIYSFGSHFPIATLHTNKQGKTVVLFTTRGYSNTTAKHISCVRAACSQYELIYCMNPENAIYNSHSDNLKAFESAAKGEIAKLSKANKPEIYLTRIAAQKELAVKYAEYFGLLKSKEFKALSYIHIVTKEGGKVAGEKERKAYEAHQKLMAKRQAENHKKALIQEDIDVRHFKNFKKLTSDGERYINVDRVSSSSGNSYLRFNSETNRIETSQRVEVPIKIAERAFKWILKTIEAGGCSGECNFKVLEFEVLEVNPVFCRIGCHRITIAEIKSIGKQMNWL